MNSTPPCSWRSASRRRTIRLPFGSTSTTVTPMVPVKVLLADWLSASSELVGGVGRGGGAKVPCAWRCGIRGADAAGLAARAGAGLDGGGLLGDDDGQPGRRHGARSGPRTPGGRRFGLVDRAVVRRRLRQRQRGAPWSAPSLHDRTGDVAEQADRSDRTSGTATKDKIFMAYSPPRGCRRPLFQYGVAVLLAGGARRDRRLHLRRFLQHLVGGRDGLAVDLVGALGLDHVDHFLDHIDVGGLGRCQNIPIRCRWRDLYRGRRFTIPRGSIIGFNWFRT